MLTNNLLPVSSTEYNDSTMCWYRIKFLFCPIIFVFGAPNPSLFDAVLDVSKNVFNQSTILFFINSQLNQNWRFGQELASILKSDWAIYLYNNYYIPPPKEFGYFKIKKVKQIIIVFNENTVSSPTLLTSNIAVLKQNPAWSSYASIIVATNNSNSSPQVLAQSIITELWRQTKATNIVVVAPQMGKILLYSWKPYSPTCDINVFIIGEWNNSLQLTKPIFPSQNKWNLNQCALKAASTKLEPFVIKTKNSIIYDSGYEVMLFQTLSEIMNFTFEYVSAPEGQTPWVTRINGEPAGLIGKLYRHEADFAFHGVRGTWDRFQIADPMDPCFEGNFVWAAPIPEKVPEWKIFILVFDDLMWLGAFLVLIISSILIQFITELEKPKACLFTWAVMFNTSIPYDSNKLVLRLFLAYLFIYVLNVTSAYQSGLFEMLSNGLNEPHFESAFEAALEGYHCSMYPSVRPEIHASVPEFYDYITSHKLDIWSEDHISSLNRIASGQKELALLPDSWILYEVNKRFTSSSGKTYVRMLKERYGPYETAFYVSRDHPLKPEAQKYMRRLIETGWTKYYTTIVLLKARTSSKDFADDPEDSLKLGLKKLRGAFIILLCLLSIALIAFAMELLIHVVSNVDFRYRRRYFLNVWSRLVDSVYRPNFKKCCGVHYKNDNKR